MSGFFNALKWSVAGEIASRLAQPLVFVILARLLTPDDYGVVAAAIMVISFTQIFWEGGMSKALIQRQNQIEASACVAFWINLSMAVGIGILLFLLSDFFADTLFKDARVGAVLRVMTLQIILGALASVQTALLQKDMKFDRLFWVRIVTVALPGFFSLPLAVYGFSYWSLVIGTLAGQAAQVVILWRICSWRPSFSFEVSVAKELGRFGFWVSLSGLLAWFYLWVDSLFIGAYLGTHQLGLYRTGNQFVIMLFGMLFTPLLPVLYSHFSGMQQDLDKLRYTFKKVVRIITFVAIPAAFVLFALALPIADIIFGQKWKGVETVIGIMALMHGFSWVAGANGEVYRAIGKPSYETIISSITLMVYIPGYFISIQYGFFVFIWVRLLLAIIALSLHIYLAWYAIRLSIFSMIRLISVASLLGSVSIVIKTIFADFFQSTWLEVIFVGSTSVVFIYTALFFLERNGLVKDLRNVLARKNFI